MLNRFGTLSRVLYMLFKYFVIVVIFTQVSLIVEGDKQIAIQDIFAIIGISIAILIILSIAEWVIAGKLIWSFKKSEIK